MFELSIKENLEIISGNISDELYDRTYDYLSNNGEMPYGIMKARTGDPYEFCLNFLTNQR